jgi:hypothetical protein
MQAIEFETPITHGEIHLKLPKEISADRARVIVLFETMPLAEQPTNSELIQFLDSLAQNPTWEIRTKEEIDQALDDLDGDIEPRTPLWAKLTELREQAAREGALPEPLSSDGILAEIEQRRGERDE